MRGTENAAGGLQKKGGLKRTFPVRGEKGRLLRGIRRGREKRRNFIRGSDTPPSSARAGSLGVRRKKKWCPKPKRGAFFLKEKGESAT